MLYGIRKVINENRLYSWMVIFIICVQAYGVLLNGEKAEPAKKTDAAARQEFKIEIEKKEEAIRNLLQKDYRVAANMGLLSLLIFAVFIAGCVFLTDYIIRKKANKIEAIPHTLDTPEPLWGLADVVKIVIIFLFFGSFFSLCAHILNGIFSTEGLDRRAGTVASTGLMDLLIFMFILYFVIVKYRQGARALGVSLEHILKNIRVALYAYVGFLPILAAVFICIVIIAKVLNYTPPPQPIYELIFEEKRPLLLFIISILVALIGPIIEEVFFRGFFYSALRKRYGIWLAISLSAFFFSLLHTNLLGFLPILILGAFLAYLREKTGSLMPSIAVHIVHNTLLASFMFMMRELTSMAALKIL